MSGTYLFTERVIKAKTQYSGVFGTDGTDFYRAEARSKQLFIKKLDGDVIVSEIDNHARRGVDQLYCKRMHGKLYFVILYRKANNMILYKGNKQTHSTLLIGRCIDHADEKGPVFKYTVSDRGLVQYSIHESKIATRIICIGPIIRQFPFNRCTSVSNTDKYLYIAYGNKIIKHEHETNQQAVINITDMNDEHTLFSTDGNYVATFGYYLRTLTSRCVVITTASVSDEQEVLLAFDREKYGSIADPLIAVVDGYILFKYKDAFSCKTYNTTTRQLAVIGGAYDFISPSYKYVDINGGRLCSFTDEEIRVYRFKWNIKHVGIQTSDIQKTVITIFLCLKRKTNGYMPRDLIYVIINHVYS